MDDEQLFDQPVEAYLADSNVLKWLKPSNEPSNSGLDPSLRQTLKTERQELFTALKSTFNSWDPNRGPEHEEELRSELEKRVNSIAARALARLSEKQKESVRSLQRRDMGFSYIFVAAPDELLLDVKQQRELAELSARAAEQAAATTRRDMDRIQIRNPQAFLAYKLSKLFEETHKSRLQLGQEFYERELTQEQRDRLPLTTP